jgi:hypothetical protein
MRQNLTLFLAALITAVMLGCATSQSVMVPPRIDLKQHEMIGVIEFDASSKGELGPLATRRFTEEARRDQGLVRMVGVGSETEAIRSVGGTSLGVETFKALGRAHDVQTILTGELTVSRVRPDLKLAPGLRSGRLSAQVEATLAVQLIEASTGASLWSSSATATSTLGQISVFKGGDFVFDADDPEKAYAPLVDALVSHVTQDFRVRWERR